MGPNLTQKLLHSKRNQEQTKRQAAEWQETFANDMTNSTHNIHCCLVTKSCLSGLHGLESARILCPWGFPDKNTGVGSHFLLQGIFPTQGMNASLLHGRWILYH